MKRVHPFRTPFANDTRLSPAADVAYRCWWWMRVPWVSSAYPRVVGEAAGGAAAGGGAAAAARCHGGRVVRDRARGDGEKHSQVRQGKSKPCLSKTYGSAERGWPLFCFARGACVFGGLLGSVSNTNRKIPFPEEDGGESFHTPLIVFVPSRWKGQSDAICTVFVVSLAAGGVGNRTRSGSATGRAWPPPIWSRRSTVTTASCSRWSWRSTSSARP